MFEIRQVRDLKARKASLVSECALDRSVLAAQSAAFVQKTGWAQMLFSGAKLVLPRLGILFPVAGWLISRGFSRKGGAVSSSPGPNIVGLVRKGMLAWQLFKKGRQIWSEWSGQRKVRGLKSAA